MNMKELLDAIKTGDLKKVQELLKISTVKEKVRASAWNNEVLKTAIENHRLEIVRELLQIDAIKAQTAAWPQRPLEIAIEIGHLEITRELLRMDIAKAIIFSSTWTTDGPQPIEKTHAILRVAAESGSLDIVFMLIQIYQSSKVNPPVDLRLRLGKDSPEIMTLEEVHKHLCEVNRELEEYLPSVITNIVKAYASLPCLLRPAKPVLTLQSESKKQAEIGVPKVPKRKEEAEIYNLNKFQNIRPFLEKCKVKGDGDKLPESNVAFRRAAAAGLEAITRALAENDKSLDINQPGAESGKTALHFAVIKGRKNVASQLIEMGAKQDIQDAQGKTASDYAAESTDEGIKKLFAIKH